MLCYETDASSIPSIIIDGLLDPVSGRLGVCVISWKNEILAITILRETPRQTGTTTVDAEPGLGSLCLDRWGSCKGTVNTRRRAIFRNRHETVSCLDELCLGRAQRRSSVIPAASGESYGKQLRIRQPKVGLDPSRSCHGPIFCQKHRRSGVRYLGTLIRLERSPSSRRGAVMPLQRAGSRRR